MEALTDMQVSVVAEITSDTAQESGTGPADDIERMLREVIEIAAKLAYETALGRTEAQACVTDGSQAEDKARFIEELIRQEDEIRQERPEFDLASKIAESGAFRALILAGEPVRKALGYVEPEREMERMETDVLGRIRKRNLRPAPMASGNRPVERDTGDRLNEEEMRRIDAQLKRGQKVYI